MQKRRLIIVEEESRVADDLADRLKEIGYEVTAIATSGEEAMAVLQTAPADMVLVKVRPKDEPPLHPEDSWMKTIFDSMPNATIVTDPEGCIQFYNAQAGRILGCGPQEFVGWKWTDATSFSEELTRAPIEDLLPLATLETGPIKLPHGAILHNRSGTKIAVEGEVSPVVSQGKLVGRAITLRDVSQRNQEQSEMRQEEKMLALGRLAGGVARDLNDLLQVILGHGSLLSSVISEQGDGVSIRAILDAARMSSEITKQLLALSRRQVLAEQVFEVNDCVERMVRLLASRLGSGFQLKVDLDPETGKVKMNEGQFDQILLNLTQNARDAMPGGGTIRISTTHVERMAGRPRCNKQSYIRLRVEHAGATIPEVTKEKIFEPFFLTRPAGRGSGLGLAIVYGIVREAGGKITVESTAGMGTAFEAVIPRFEPGQPPLKNPGPKTILVVDDEFGVRKLLLNYFQQQGFRLIDAGSGEEALEAAAAYEGRIDLLISDVLMPYMDGPTLAGRLTEARPGIKTLFISAQPGDSLEGLRDEDALPFRFLQKPFALPDLLEKVEALTT